MIELSNLYYKKPRVNYLIYITFILMTFTLLYISIKYYTYDIKEILLINECDEECVLKTSLDYESQKIFNKNSIIEYDNKEYKINDIEYDEPYLVNGVPTTDITIKTDIKEDKKIIKVEVKYNKQRIIKKIKEKIIERK